MLIRVKCTQMNFVQNPWPPSWRIFGRILGTLLLEFQLLWNNILVILKYRSFCRSRTRCPISCKSWTASTRLCRTASLTWTRPRPWPCGTPCRPSSRGPSPTRPSSRMPRHSSTSLRTRWVYLKKFKPMFLLHLLNNS